MVWPFECTSAAIVLVIVIAIATSTVMLRLISKIAGLSSKEVLCTMVFAKETVYFGFCTMVCAKETVYFGEPPDAATTQQAQYEKDIATEGKTTRLLLYHAPGTSDTTCPLLLAAIASDRSRKKIKYK